MFAIKYGTHLKTNTDSFKLSKYDLKKLVDKSRRENEKLN